MIVFLCPQNEKAADLSAAFIKKMDRGYLGQPRPLFYQNSASDGCPVRCATTTKEVLLESWDSSCVSWLFVLSRVSPACGKMVNCLHAEGMMQGFSGKRKIQKGKRVGDFSPHPPERSQGVPATGVHAFPRWRGKPNSRSRLQARLPCLPRDTSAWWSGRGSHQQELPK